MSSEEFLVSKEQYLAAGVHLGTTVKTKAMRRFIYKVRSDGLAILDVTKIDERIRVAAKFLARIEPENILAVSTRIYGYEPVRKFGEVTRIRVMMGRIMPGVLTNPSSKFYCEPEIVFLSDPKVDRQLHMEAIKMGVPVMALCDTDNNVSYIDFIVPCNNKGRKSLALIYWLLARQILRERGEIPPDQEDIGYKYEDFMTKIARQD